MSKKKFVPEGELEVAIAEEESGQIIFQIVEGNRLHRPDILATDEFLNLPIRTKSVVIGCGMDDYQQRDVLSFMRSRHPESEVIYLMEDVDKIPKEEPLEDEEKLMRAIMDGNDRKICRLIEKDFVSIRSMTKERCSALCRALLHLKPYTIVLVLALGIHYASVPRLLQFLLRECERDGSLKELDYKERLMLANLLIHILQGEIEPEDDDLIEQDWYPMGNSIEDGCDRRVYCHSYSYYFDPRCIYMPRFVGGEYEKPKHSIR